MKCFFLSADRDPRPWAMVQDNFRRYAPEHWDIDLFHPFSGQNLVHAWQGLMASQASVGAPFMVMSAGVQFGPHSFETIESSVAHLSQGGGFDLLFPDLRLTQAGAMTDLFVLRRQLMVAGRTRLIDPKPMSFDSPGACIIHPRAIPALTKFAALASVDALMGELCGPVREGELMGRFIFPFATTVSTGGDANVPRDGESRAAMIGDIYRRMVWRDGGFEPELQPLAEMSKGLSMEAKAFAILWAAMAE